MQHTSGSYITGKQLIVNAQIRRVIGVMGFLVLTTAGAFIYIRLPYTPVPITLQTFFVLLSAAFLRKTDAVFTQGLYLGLGAAGLPIFSISQGGLLKLFGPTGGYIVGFVFSVFVVSYLLDYYRKKNSLKFVSTVFFLSLGNCTIYLFGGLWLYLFMHLTVVEVFILGVVPFVFADILKVIFAASIYNLASANIRDMFK